MSRFKKDDTVWFFNGDDYQKEVVVEYHEMLDMYELSDGNFYDKSDLFKSKSECSKTH